MVAAARSLYNAFCDNIGDPQEIGINLFHDAKNSYNWFDRQVVLITENNLPGPLATVAQHVFHVAPVTLFQQSLPINVTAPCFLAYFIFQRVCQDQITRECSVAVLQGLACAYAIDVIRGVSQMTPAGFISATVSLVASCYCFARAYYLANEAPAEPPIL